MTELYCWAATDVGRVRSANEDAFATSRVASSDSARTWDGSLGSEGWALVADGMGGHAAGEVASRLALECLRSVITPGMDERSLSLAIEETNNALFSAMAIRPELAGMGTTLAGVIVRADRRAVVFNAGDSRVYLLQNGKLAQLSVDHVVEGYQLTKCLGGRAVGSPVQPRISPVELMAGLRVLICTDGLTNELSDGEIADLLKRTDPAAALVRTALLRGGRDNVTAVVIAVEDSDR